MATESDWLVRQKYMSKRIMISILVAAVFLQTFFSFFSPAYEPGNECQHSADYFLGSNTTRMKEVIGVKTGDFNLARIFFNWFPDYHIICDATSFLFLAKNFPYTYQERNIYIDHPLYNFLAFIILKPAGLFLNTSSYATIFGVFILVNVSLMLAAAILFFLFLLDFISAKNAFLSALFFIVSPFSHSLISQTTSSGMIEIFVVAASLWLLNYYRKNPSRNSLITCSLIFGVLLLGKQIFAISFFVLFLSWYFKRLKEGTVFLFLQFIPTAIWFLYVRYGLHLPYNMVNVTYYDQGTWFLKSASWQPYRMGNIIISALPKFFQSLIYGFLLLPIPLSFYGLYKMELKNKFLLYFSLMASFFLLFFGMNYFRDTLAFLLFPIIYPTAVVGIDLLHDYVRKYNEVLSKVLYVGLIVLILLVSNLNAYILVKG